MYKLCIVLGWPVIKKFLMNTYQVDCLDLLSKIRQHRIISSQNLDKYYSDKAQAEDLLEEYQQFISVLMVSDQFIEIEDKNADLSKDITYYLKKKDHNLAISIGIEGDFCLPKAVCKYQYSIREACEDKNGPFSMYSVVAIFSLKHDESATKCLEWLKNQFKEENEINIIDQYVLSEERNYNSFINFIFPLFKSWSTVNIHTTINPPYKTELLNYSMKRNITINLYEYNEMHDRYITTSDRIIQIQLGLDFMKKGSDGLVVMRKSSTFTMNEKDTRRAYLEVEKDLAGKPYL